MSMKRYFIEVDITDDGGEGYPSADAATVGIHQGLPKEYFMEGDEWHIEGFRTGFDITDRVANLVEKNDEQRHQLIESMATVKIRDKKIADLEDRITNLIRDIDKKNEIIRGEAAAKPVSVGCTEDEIQVVIDVLNESIAGLFEVRLEDLLQQINNVCDGIDSIVRSNLPVMEERDMGWGDDDDLQILESYAESIENAGIGLTAKLDSIRTGR